MTRKNMPTDIFTVRTENAPTSAIRKSQFSELNVARADTKSGSAVAVAIPSYPSIESGVLLGPGVNAAGVLCPRTSQINRVPAERSPAGTSLLECSYATPRRQKLLQRTVDRSELFVEVRSDAVNHSDNGQRDAGCNQTIFNRGSARFIRQKIQQGALQFCLLRVKGW